MANPLPSGIITLSRDGDSFIIPVNPPSLPIRRGRHIEEVEIINYRTVARYGNRKLAELEIRDTFFPEAYDASFCNYSTLRTPWESASLLSHWTEDDPPAPVFVTITGTMFGSWMVITDFETEDRAGEPGDLYYSLSLRTYVFTKTTIFDAA